MKKETSVILDGDNININIEDIVKSDSKRILPLIKDYIKNKEIADIGCGTGFTGRFMSEWYGSIITMLDIEDNRNINNKNFNFFKSTSEKIPLNNESVDVCYIQYVLHHLTISPVILLNEAYRISKSNLILVEECNIDNKYSLNKFIDKDVEMNKILHPESSYPIIRFFNNHELDDFIKKSNWIIEKQFTLNNEDYLPVNIYVLKK